LGPARELPAGCRRGRQRIALFLQSRRNPGSRLCLDTCRSEQGSGGYALQDTHTGTFSDCAAA
jgi:hypothetical protein